MIRRLLLAFVVLLLTVAPTSAHTETIRILGMGQSLSLQVSGIAEEVQYLTGQAAVHRKFGVGASPYIALQPGSEAYLASIEWQGVNIVDIIHGEGDSFRGTTSAQYVGYLNEWQATYSADYGFDMPLVTDQMSSLGNYWQPETVSQIALAQFEAARLNPSIYLVGPKYQYPYDETELHLTPSGNRWSGEQHGKVVAAVLSGAGWRPLEPEWATANGDTIFIYFHVPVPPLQIDTTTLPERPFYGFEWQDSTGAEIVGITVGNAWVRLQLSHPVTSGIVRYAYTGTTENCSRWGNIKDSDQTSSLTGNDLSNWLVHFEIGTLNRTWLPLVISGDGMYEE